MNWQVFDAKTELVDSGTSMMGPMREQLRALIVGVVGHEPAATELLMDSVMGAVVIRTAMLGQEIDPDRYADEVLALVRSVG